MPTTRLNKIWIIWFLSFSTEILTFIFCGNCLGEKWFSLMEKCCCRGFLKLFLLEARRDLRCSSNRRQRWWWAYCVLETPPQPKWTNSDLGFWKELSQLCFKPTDCSPNVGILETTYLTCFVMKAVLDNVFISSYWNFR